MVYAYRTRNRKRRRELIRTIINNFILINEANDTELEKIPLVKLNSISIDTYSFLKWIRHEYRELSGIHICQYDADATNESMPKNQELNNVSDKK